jgi:hypothetical protein
MGFATVPADHNCSLFATGTHAMDPEILPQTLSTRHLPSGTCRHEGVFTTTTATTTTTNKQTKRRGEEVCDVEPQLS